MKERDALRQAFQSNPKLARELMSRVSPIPPDDDEELGIICMRWPGLIDDSRKVSCSRCSHAVALAPSSQQLVDTHKGQIIFLCVECMVAPAN